MLGRPCNACDVPRIACGAHWTPDHARDTLRIMISVESTTDTIHLHIPRAEVSDARLAQLLRGLRLEAAVAGNRLTDAEADAMAEEMKADWWARNQHRNLPPADPAEA